MIKLSNDENVQNVFEIFESINKIPRCSKNEKNAINCLQIYATQEGWETEIDKIGNLLIKVKSKDESKETVCLQAHIDMVCLKNANSNHDFTKDIVEIVEENGWLKSKNGTTLGADNGIGLAIAFALAQEDFKKPNLEILVTIDEETGLTGAKNLELDIKSRTLINLDSEEEGIFSIGCAGGTDCEGITEINYVDNVKNTKGYELIVKDLPGGHSGANIHENHRINAIQLLTRTLLLLEDVQIAEINGGEVRNSIPKFCVARFITEKTKSEILKILENKKKKYPELNFELLEIKIDKVATKSQTDKILKTIFSLPSNIMEISNTIANLIQTSCNLGTIQTENGYIKIGCLLRSSNNHSLERYVHKVQSLLELGDFNVKVYGNYPGWNPEPNSNIVKISKESYKELIGKEPIVGALHAGLECGILKGKFPNLEAISIGPNLFEAHTPAERVEIKSVENTYYLIKRILEKLA